MAALKHSRLLTLAPLITSSIALLVACAGLVGYEHSALKRDMVADLAIAAQTVGINSASALTSGDATSARQTLQSLSVRPNVIAACLYDQRGRIFATYPAIRPPGLEETAPTGASEKFEADHLGVFRPITISSQTIGTIYVRAGLGSMRERIRRYAFIIVGVMLVSLLIGWGIGTRLHRTGEHVRQAAHDLLEQRTTELQRETAERKRAEEALQASEEFRTSLLETLPVFIFRKDREGRITFANQRFCDRYGRTYAEVVGRTAFDLLPATDAEQQTSTDAHVMATGARYEAIEESRRERDSPAFIQLLKVPVFDRAGQAVGVQGMFLDVTERMQAELRLAEASALLEAMLENSPDFIYFKDRESRFVRFSRAVLRRFNLDEPTQLLGRTDADVFSPQHASPAYHDEQEIIRTGTPVVGKLERETHTNGQVTWALTTKMPWRDGAGKIVGIFGISKDVTPLKQAEVKLAYERDQLRALLDSSPDTIYFKDRQSRFVRVSRSKVRKTLERLPGLCEQRAAKGLPRVGLEGELLDGLTDFDTYQGGDAQAAFDVEQEILRTGQPVSGKVEKQVFLNGAVCWSLTSKMPWRDGQGNIIGTFGISKDITDLKEAEDRLAELNKQLHETSRQAGMAEVATGVLHNVGNVLNSVNVSATLVADHVHRTKAGKVAKIASLLAQHKANLGEFLTKDARGQVIPEYLGTLGENLAAENRAIITELDHLRKNVAHIKDIVGMQQSYARNSGVFETISVPDMIEDALRMNAGSLARHDVQATRDYQARPVVTTDKHKVIQILINLVRNAKYACDEAGRTDKVILVRTTADEHGVKIAVIDNGVGIAPENLTRIFAHGFTTRKHGHGFGLHSGALAAKEIGGTLTVESEGPGKGATFALTLPYAQKEVAA